MPLPTLAGALSAGEILRQAVAPLVFVYALFLGLLALRVRIGPRPTGRPAVDRSRPPRPAWPSLLRRTAVTALGGYLVFLAVAAVFYGVLGREDRSFLVQAVWGGAFLGFAVAVPILTLIGAVSARTSRRR